ncbi:MAG: hypothetical protein R3D58_15175 [Saprospiraceae bacterium]
MKHQVRSLSGSVKNLNAFCSIVFILLVCTGMVYGVSIRQNQIPGINSIFQNYNKLHLINRADSTVFAKVIIYRADNQLSRKYKINTNLNGAFEMARKEAISIDAYHDTFTVTVSAVGHKSERFVFNLTANKTHYFRVQDRNNYSGFRAFLEIIEVTEETFRREKL